MSFFFLAHPVHIKKITTLYIIEYVVNKKYMVPESEHKEFVQIHECKIKL